MSESKMPPAFGEGLSAQPAVVKPRGHRVGSKASVPLEQLVLPLVRANSSGLILLDGGHGSGKTTALRHLRAVLPPDAKYGLFEQGQASAAGRCSLFRPVVLAVSERLAVYDLIDAILISPWTIDDCMEYLIATHRDRCASVLGRLGEDESVRRMEGSPELLTLVMDAMAVDAQVRSAREVIEALGRRIVPRQAARDHLLTRVPAREWLSAERWRWLRHTVVRDICIADWVAIKLSGGVVPDQFEKICKGKIEEIGIAVRNQPAAAQCLERLLASARRLAVSGTAASILLAADENWRPADGRGLNLRDAKLSGAQWAGVDLRGAFLMGANFSGADLSGADLSEVNLQEANLVRASLRGAGLENAWLASANLESADLRGAIALNADFSDANLKSADLGRGSFQKCRFIRANLQHAFGDSADFSSCRLMAAHVADANFAGANFNLSEMENIHLSGAVWTRASFAGAKFKHCNLEGLELPEADFDGADLSGCLLTGSRIPRGRFREANLSSTGLAEIEWDGADLRDANLSRASFHLGSSRSGLVGSTIPSEGSKTGFYTDEFNEQSYKAPEEIRKACLCGANLIGANLDRTDFYLVDLRNAVYSESQGRHFARTGAILKAAKA